MMPIPWQHKHVNPPLRPIEVTNCDNKYNEGDDESMDCVLIQDAEVVLNCSNCNPNYNEHKTSHLVFDGPSDVLLPEAGLINTLASTQ